MMSRFHGGVPVEFRTIPWVGVGALTLLEPQSRFGDKPIKFKVVCPQNGTAVLKGFKQ